MVFASYCRKWLLFLLTLFILDFDSNAHALVSCGACPPAVCSRCMDADRRRSEKEKEVIRITDIISRNKEMLRTHKETSVLIKVNSNILLASLTKDALESEIEHLDSLIDECRSCSSGKLKK